MLGHAEYYKIINIRSCQYLRWSKITRIEDQIACLLKNNEREIYTKEKKK